MSDGRVALVFYATDDTYAIAALVFVRLLRDLGLSNDADVLALHLPLAPLVTVKMAELGIRSVPVEPLGHGANAYFRHCFVKLRIFELTDYERVLFVDADALPLKSLDDLLSLTLTAKVASPRAYWLKQPYWTSALLLVRPCETSWARLKRRLEEVAERDVYDMDLINEEFADEIQSLDEMAFCLNSEWEDTRRPGHFADPEATYAAVSVVHFTALGKPWRYSTDEARLLRPYAHPIFYDLWDRWRTTRDALFK